MRHDQKYPDVGDWIETPGGYYGLHPDGIAVGVIKAVHHTEEIARTEFQVIADLVAGRPRPMLLDALDILGIDRAARRFWAHDPGIVEIETAVAMMVGSASSRMLANLFIRIDRPIVPYRMFTDSDAALAWLRTHLADGQS